MERIKLVVTDLDSTLLRADKTASGYTLDVLQRVREKGVDFAVATARPIRAVKSWLSWLEFDAGIFHNGAVVLDGDRRVRTIGIDDPMPLVRRILSAAPGCRFSVESKDRLFANFNAGEIWEGIVYTQTEDFRELGDDPADKLLLSAVSPEKMEEIAALLPPELYMQLSENILAMIMHRDAKKENGVRILAERRGIRMEEVAAFGDDLNDEGMLRTVGYGVAVENALESVKKAAKYRTGSCEADGVARWLERVILQGKSPW